MQGEVHQHVHPKVSGDNLVCLLLMDFGKWNMEHGCGVDRTFKKSPRLEIGHVEGQTCNQALQ
jgi:hypothetical protein